MRLLSALPRPAQAPHEAVTAVRQYLEAELTTRARGKNHFTDNLQRIHHACFTPVIKLIHN